MKDFLKQTLAVMTGIILITVIMGIVGIISIIGMIASLETTKTPEKNSVMVINLEGSLEERAETSDIIGMLGGGGLTEETGLDDLLSAIAKAKTDDNIRGIYIRAGVFTADSYASMAAVRNALTDFRQSGKWIVAYGDTYTQGTYYICSAADKVLVNPQGMIDWHGLASQTVYVRDLLAKAGIRMQLSKVGRYKSAPDMFTSDKMSDNDREQITAYVNGIWNDICADVSADRNIAVDSLNAMADGMIVFADADEYVRRHLADTLVYACDVDDYIKRMMDIGTDDDLNTIDLADMAGVKGSKPAGGEIAVYYACGNIVDNDEQSGLSSGGTVINARRVCDDLLRLADDDDVKAVVMRVNSGGGSAYASEQIWNAVTRLKARKPVVVSMGGAAASGGYYISCAADRIVAEPVTLTGSIGIFGMFPDFSELLTDKLGLRFDGVHTNRHSDFGTMARPFNDEEMAYINAYIERGYGLFVRRVADGRGMTAEQVDSIAQGRVWTGRDALGINLVDRLGGLDDAVAEAASLAHIDEWHTVSYPDKEDWLDVLLRGMTADSHADARMRTVLGDCYRPLMLIMTLRNANPVQARMPYIINIR